jgi:uncharacterized membrane protein YfcA
MVNALPLTLVSAGVLLGAATQRSSGLGFNLVSSPFLVLVLGPHTGVSLGNLLSALVCVVVLGRTWRGLDWRRAGLLALPAIAAVPFGALVVATLPRPVLSVLVGAMAVVAMLIALRSDRASVFRGTGGAVVAGALSGFMNVTAGVGGPMITVHALSERWPPERFVPTAQACLLVVNGVSLVAKGAPAVSAGVLVAALLLVLTGAVAGEWLTARLNRTVVHRIVVAVALAGGVATMVSGLLAV